MALTQTGPAWLFCPADRPERFEKAAAAADVVILDLEDGVAAKDRDAARTALIDTPLDPARTVVRINPSTTADHQLDLEALSRTSYTTVMLAKTEDAQQVRDLAPLDVVVLIETPLGALAVNDLARMDNSLALMWGAEDLFAVLGGTANRYPSRSSPACAVTDAAGGQGIRTDGAGFGVPRYQGPRRPGQRGRRRGGRRLRREGRDSPVAGRGHSCRLRADR
jgi:citrate lyase beta subunit